MIHGKSKGTILKFCYLFYDICMWIEVDKKFDSSIQNNNKHQIYFKKHEPIYALSGKELTEKLLKLKLSQT